MLDLLTLKPAAFGLDISDLSLKVINLKKTKTSFVVSTISKKEKSENFFNLASFGEAKIEPGIIEEGEIKKEEVLVEVIRKSLSQVKGEKLKTKYVIASLPEEKAFLQVVQMPKMKEEEIKKAVQFEAENYIPLPISEVYFDSQIIPPVLDSLDHVDLLIAALPKKVVDSYLSCLGKAGLLPIALEIESQAVSRALVKGEMNPTPILIIDFGATRANLVVFAGYSLRFTSAIAISSALLTRAIASTLKIDANLAEKLKFKYGLGISEKMTPEEKNVSGAITPILTNFVGEIKKYLDYYQTHTSHEHLPSAGKAIEKVYLCGGGANLKGLPNFLSERLGLPVELGNPWANILPSPLREVPELSYQDSLGYTTALGLALRGAREKDYD